MMKEKKKTKKKERKHFLLTKEKNIKLLQLCLQNANLYKTFKMMITWWNNIIKKFHKWLIQKETINFSRHVIKLIKEKKLQIKMLTINDENEKKFYIDVIDK
jgi:hypothetical protein